jgi:hypothetical protein
LFCLPSVPWRLILLSEQRVGDGDILFTHTQEKGVWMKVLVRFQPQFAWKLDDGSTGALPMARGCLGERFQLLGWHLAYGRREADSIAVSLGRLDDLRSQRASGVVVVPE